MPKKKDKRIANTPKAAYLWSLCSKVVREADDYTCRKCGKNWRYEPGFLDGAHCEGRRKGSVKYVYTNVLSLCRIPCHSWFDELSSYDHNDFVCEQIGEEAYEALKLQARGMLKLTPSDKRELARGFREDLAFLHKCRATGETGNLRHRLEEK